MAFGSYRQPCILLVATAALCLISGAALGQEEITGGPEFAYGTQTEVTETTWTASVGAGLILNSGNSNVTAFSGNAAASINTGTHQFAFEGNGAYARSQVLVAEDINADSKLQRTEITSQPTVSVRNWLLKGRYDYFLGDAWTVYISLSGGADPIAGKELVAGGQFGASYRLFEVGRHKMSTELGYDFSFEQYVSPPGSSLEIHSVRGFLGYTLTLADEIGVKSGLEVLSNLNPEITPTGTAAPLEDTRVIGKVVFDAKVYGNITARFGFSMRFDNVPAPRPKPETELPYDGFVLEADKLDTRTDVALIVNFQ